MGVWESNTIEKNFDELINELQKAKEYTLNKVKTLEDVTNIKKVQQFLPLHIEGIRLQTATENGWYDKGTYIRIDFNSTTEKLLKSQPELRQGLSFYKQDWSFMYVRINEESEKESKEKFSKLLDNLYLLDQTTHQQNRDIRTSNAATHEMIFKILERVGISKSYYGYKSSRSSQKSEMYYNFPSEISKQIPTHYSDNKLDDTKKEKLKSFNDIYDREVRKIREVRIQKEKEEKQKRENKVLALLLAKYDLDLEDEWSDLMDAIIKKNKYLRLGHYLYMNRCDWNDGYSYAKSGLQGFKCESELDNDIYDDIQGYIDNWDGDGRVFRDCKYNYDYLFGLVEDADLFKDYETVREKVDE
jgi:hypothetical protein